MNLKENWGLKIDIGIYKDLSKFPNNHARKILEAIENFASNPYVGDIRKIKNEKNLLKRNFISNLNQRQCLGQLLVQK